MTMHFDQCMELKRAVNPDLLLLYAAKYRDKYEYEKAVGAGADLNARESVTGFTPLMNAARSGQVWIVKDLHRRGADLDRVDLKGRTALHHAFNTDHIYPPTDPDVKALEGNRTVVAILLIELGASQSIRDFRGNFPLHLACINGNFPAVNAMVNAGALIKARNMDGDTPLILAASIGSARISSLLLDRGADISDRNNDGDTALHFSACFGHIRTVSLLLVRSAEIDAKDCAGRTARDLAYLNHHYSIVRMLEERGSA